MLRRALLLVAVTSLSTSLFVSSSAAAEEPPAAPALPVEAAPLPGSLEEAAAQAEDTGPGKQTPTLPVIESAPEPTSAPPLPRTTVDLPETGAVAGWAIKELSSGRRRPDGTPTSEACGYERDVVVTRSAPTAATTPAVLVVGCDLGSDGYPVAAAPLLRLPPPYGPAVNDATTAAGNLELGVSGALTLADVVAAITPLRPAVAACHTRLGGPQGRLVMRAVVDGTGTVTEAAGLDGDLKGTTLDACVADVLKTARFIAPADAEPAVVSAAFTFAQTGPGLAKTPAIVPTVLRYRACAAGEDPEMRNGEPTCSVVVVGRPCAPGEMPASPTKLAPGESGCVNADATTIPFFKGELTHLGDVQLINARTSFGVGLGLVAIDGVYYAVARPDLNLKFGRLSLGFGAPLRFQLLDLSNIDIFAGDPTAGATDGIGRFRTEDWDQIEDFLRPIRYLTFGKKEDELYIDVNRIHAITLGHGQLMRRYQPNLDIDEDNLFAEVDAYGDYGGIEFMTGPFPLPRLVGGLGFIKPLGIINAFSPIGDDHSYLRQLASSWSVGVSYIADLNSPTALDKRNNPVDGRQQLIVDQANQFLWKGRDGFVGSLVQGVGVDTEVKVLKLQNIDVKVYGDYSHLFFPADTGEEQAFSAFDGGGYTVGGLLRVSFGETPVRRIEDEDEATKAGRSPREKMAAHAFRVRLEGRTFSPTFLPSYFNTMYEVDRLQFGFNDDRVGLPTKIRYLADQASDPWRVGYFAEVSYAWVNVLGVTAAFEDAYPLGGNEPVRGKNLALHVESQGLGWLQLFASYHFRNFEPNEAKRVLSFNSDQEIMFLGGRLQILPVMFLNVSAQRAFRIGFSQDDVTSANADGQRFTSLGMKNAWVSGFDIELGWQF